MSGFDLLAERKIEEALARGELSDLPGAGRPLDLDTDPLIPEDLRMAYRILKNAGFVPPEVEHIREIGEIERAVLRGAEAGDAERISAARRLALLRTKIESRYYARALDKLGRP